MRSNSDITVNHGQSLQMSGGEYAFLNKILCNSADLITIHDAATNQIIYCNHDNFWKHAFDPDEVYKMRDEERVVAMIDDDYLDKARAFLAKRRLIPDGESAVAELKLKNGTWIRIHSKVFKRKSNGDALQILSFTSDVTEVKKAEHKVIQLRDEIAQAKKMEADKALHQSQLQLARELMERRLAQNSLRKNEEKYRSLFESIDEGFSLLEMIFDEEGKIVDYWHREYNPSFARMMGISNALGKRMSELLPNVDTGWYRTLEKVYQTGDPLRVKYPLQEVNQWYTCYLTRVGGERSPFIAAVCDDITESKRHERNQALLAEITKDLVEIHNIGEVMEGLAKKISKHFKVPWCSFTELTDDQETAIASYEWNAENVPSMKGIFQLADLWTTEQRARNSAGETSVAFNTQNDSRLNAEAFTALGIGSFVMVPLSNNGKFRLMIMDVDPRQWRDDEIALMQEIVSRIWSRWESARAQDALRVSEARMRGLKETFQSVINGAPLHVSLNILSKVVINELQHEARIAFYSTDANGTRLHPIWDVGNMPNSYLKQMDGFDIGEESIACGLAMPSGRPVLTTDVFIEPLWKPWLDEQFQIRGCWSFPIKTREKNPVGIFALYFQDARNPSGQDLALVDLIGQAASVILSRHEETERRNVAEKKLQDAQAVYRNELQKEVRDRTRELRESKDELEREHHFLEQVTDKTPLLIYVYDLQESRFTFINKQVERFIGRDQDYVYAMGPHLFQAILHPDDVSNRARYMEELSTMTGLDVREMDFRIWNGEEFRWFRSRDSIFMQDHTRVKQVIGIAEDITFEKKFQEKTNDCPHTIELN